MKIREYCKYVFDGRAQRAVYVQAFVFALLCGALYFAWTTYKPRIVEQETYKIAPKNLRIVNAPDWVPDDFVSAALDRLPPETNRDELNSLDRSLASNLASAFSSCPWVEQVVSIKVSYPAVVEIELKFRRPVAFVDPDSAELPELLNVLAERFPEDDLIKSVKLNTDGKPRVTETRDRGVFLVDAHGKTLDLDFYRYCDETRGLPTIRTYGPPLDYLDASAALADFLEQNDVVQTRAVKTIHVLKALGQTQPVFFISAGDEQIVKWGVFALPSGYKVKGRSVYPSASKRVLKEDEKKALYAFQRNKLKAWSGEETTLDLSDGDRNERIDPEEE